ncbi:hypothetical protein KIN20_005214 [Parelaphostrongylus tenuis]|uniref:Uncharacterized protein n=1 Tax=Parelaphostrongylus tenuis TaxID=148309 RepID=A0AAD5M005_PARTN|nr:hypothetical protein KIN20_005214 [Parelaphostrongylus tenuis]
MAVITGPQASKSVLTITKALNFSNVTFRTSEHCSWIGYDSRTEFEEIANCNRIKYEHHVVDDYETTRMEEWSDLQDISEMGHLRT